MEVNAFESLYTPYVRLVEANAQLMQKLPTTSTFIPVAWPSVQGSLSDSKPSQQPTLPAGTYASMVLEMASNWMRFWNELSQSMLALLAQAQDAATSPPQREAAGVIKGANGRGPARHTRTTT